MSRHTVLLTGGTGLIGTALTAELLDAGHRVHVLTRTPTRSASTDYREFAWNPYREHMDAGALEGITHVYNMVGANINGKRWTDTYREQILNSRVLTTRFLIDQLLASQTPLPRFISFSATGIYGDHGAEHIDERTPAETEPFSDFLSEVCYRWEQEARRIPSTILRVAPVLDHTDGALPTLVSQSSRGIIAMVGSSLNYFSWIHIEDLIRICMTLLDGERPYCINAAAPRPVTNHELMSSVQKHFGLRGLLVTIPCWVIRLMVGGVATELCKSLAAHSAVLDEMGYRFRYPDIDTALQSLAAS